MINSTYPGDTLIHVIYIDYGNTDWVTLDLLRVLPSDLHEIPAQAFPCCLMKVSFIQYLIPLVIIVETCQTKNLIFVPVCLLHDRGQHSILFLLLWLFISRFFASHRNTLASG